MANENTAIAAAQAVKALSILHNNEDDISAKLAIRAAEESRPAFWSTARYHDQSARIFLDEANDLPLAEAISQRLQVRQCRAADLLNTLIPLNAEAAKALVEARGRI